MGFKKRGAIYSIIALMLCVAVYLNWSYSRGNAEAEVNGGATGRDQRRRRQAARRVDSRGRRG
jgi:hypothetical protein